ncbi:MAG: hypothetical protein ACE5H7_11510 [Acidiferrobacterales bacterium]
MEIRRPYLQGAVIFLWIVWLAVILVASFMPEDTPASEVLSPRWWNLFHIPAYGILALLSLLMFTDLLRAFSALRLSISFIVVSLIGLIAEALQPAFGREMSVVDFSYNQLGIICGLGFLLAVKRLWLSNFRT